MSAPGTPLMGSLPPSSVEGRRVRVLRPVSRPSPSGSPALSGLSQLRTNRPLQSGPPAVEPQPAPLPHMPLTTFAIKALGLIAKLRERIDKQGSMVLSGNEVAHAVREVEKLYNDLEYLAQGFQLRQVDSKSGTNYLNSASQLPDSMTTLNNLTDAFRTDEYLNLASIAWGDQVSRTPYLNVTKNVVSAVKENTELAVIKVKDSHDRFVNSVRFLLTKERELQLRQIKQRMTLHECGFLSHVIEAELGRRNDPPTTFVPLIKATVLVQYGHICIIRLGSLDETLWTADGVVEDSVHEVYRLMSHSATSRLLSTSSAARLQTSSTVTALLAFLQGYTTVFSTPCCSCKKLMRDFLPPTRLLEGSRTAYQHVSCQHLPTNDG